MESRLSPQPQWSHHRCGNHRDDIDSWNNYDHARLCPSDCALKDSIRNSLVIIKELPLGPEASKLLKLALGTNLTAYFDNGVDSAGSIAATLAHTIPQIVRCHQERPESFQAVYGILDQIFKESAELASCTGAKADCTGLVVLSGYVIKIGVPILRAYLTFKFPPAAAAFIVLQPTIGKTADGLIASNDAGLTDFLKLIVDQTTGIAGTLLPSPLEEILGITGPTLSIVKNCPADKGRALFQLDLTTLDLEDNSIGDNGAQALSEALKANSTLTTLDLSRNPIESDGAQALSEALMVNSTLTTLSLGGTSIGDNGAQALSEALRTNSTVTIIGVVF
ncbi:hypothetical protein KI688_011987 [Linnemannia hyalina]|uniref:RNI-like protein n=1 Tax=Linnemannia hyalina TaxID=64524 RepID=A0A9P7XTV8_9FUNG|nr:hypothetical protein KI688_011987 [Linnemannia hyalina]